MAQYPNNFQAADLALQGILFNNNYASTQQQGLLNGEAALINSQGNYLLNESQANINNQTAYSMQLDNKNKKIRTYFNGRQINSYYRDIEAWQKKEKARLRYSGKYDKEAIENIYNVYKP